MKTFDEEIARRIKEAADSGELRTAESYGKPLLEHPGWEATPEALRMPMKIRKDAGATPQEIEWVHQRAHLQASIGREVNADERRKLQLRLIEIEQKIALRLEALRIHSQL